MTPESQQHMIANLERERDSIAAQSVRNAGEMRERDDRVKALDAAIDRLRQGIFGNTA